MYLKSPDIQQEQQPVLLYTFKYNNVLYGYYQIADSNFYLPLKVLKDTFICNPDTVKYLYDDNNIFNLDPHLIFDKQLSIKPEEAATKKKQVIIERNKTENQKEIKSLNYKNELPDWIIVFLSVSLIFVALLRFFYKGLLVKYLKAALNYNLSEKIYKEAGTTVRKFSFLNNILFVFNTGILLFYFLNYYQFSFTNTLPEIYLLLSSFALVTLIILSKVIILKLLGALFKIQDCINEFVHNIFIYYKLFALISTPVIIVYPYIDIKAGNILLIICGVLFIVLYMMQLLRGIIIAYKNKLSLFYIFLYLCTLEILPVIVIYMLYGLYIGD
ncbi:MAG: hypothetical protein Kow0068_00720 [Marinilabiliales bacterium]